MKLLHVPQQRAVHYLINSLCKFIYMYIYIHLYYERTLQQLVISGPYI
jgi:hypothetical protein